MFNQFTVMRAIAASLASNSGLHGRPRMRAASSSSDGPRRPAGSKLSRKTHKGMLTMQHPGGLVSEAMRNIVKQKNLAKLAQRKAAA